ncbi:MAG: hypothetical protein OXR67_17545 [Chloroflexota bacterium]|nr:hypothetical protein [Chloroflexota bacterium]
MVNARFSRTMRLLALPGVLVLIMAIACGTSAPEVPETAATGSSTQASAQQSASQQTSSQPAASQQGSSQQSKGQGQAQDSAPAAPPPARVLAAATATPLPAAIRETPSEESTEGFVDFDIKDPVIDPDRSRQSEGKMVLAYHTALSPKWSDPQVAPASRTPYSAFLQNVFEPLIGAMPNGRFVYLLAEDLEMTDDFMKATFRLR